MEMGGKLAQSEGQGVYSIYSGNNDESLLPSGTQALYSRNFVWMSISKSELQPVAAHLLRAKPGTQAVKSNTKVDYTRSEDNNIIEYCLKVRWLLLLVFADVCFLACA